MPVLPEEVKRPTSWQEVRALWEPEGWEIRRPEVAAPEGMVTYLDVLYVQRPERDLKLDLFLPGKIERAPLVVIIHGGGWHEGSKEAYHPHAKWLAARGYAVASIQYRLSGKAPFPAAIHDCKEGVRWLRKHSQKFGYDPDHIGVYGGSAGAHLAALVAATGPQRGALEAPGANLDISSEVQAAVVIAGPTDTTCQTVRDQSLDRENNYFRFMGGSYWDIPQTYILASPANWVTEKSPPTLLIAEYSLDSSHLFLCLLKRAGVDVDTMILSGAIHHHWNWEPWFTPALERVDTFLKKALSH